VRTICARNLARVVVAGIVLAGSPLAMAGTANAVQTTPTASDDVWDQIAQCESGGRWNTNTGNGYAGGLQFSPHTWRAYGGSGSASSASRTVQIAVAERVLAAQGWGAWPVCSRKANARGRATQRTVPATLHTTATRTTEAKVKPLTAEPAAPKLTVVADSRYAVVTGDTLSKIAQRRNISGGWQSLYQRNQAEVANPNALKIGQEFNLD
jgi:LysM repeat protein